MKKGFIALATLLLSGCSSIVAYQIQNPTTQDINGLGDTAALLYEVFDVSSKHYCADSQTCFDNLSAPALAEGKLQLNFEFPMAVGEEVVSTKIDQLIKAKKENLAANKTVVLLHGYSMAKEQMLIAATQLQLYGFNVLVPDLAGHGSSTLAFGVGVQDASTIAQFVNDTVPNEHQVYLLGLSLGCLTALHASQSIANLKGAIYIAPPQVFDKSVQSVAKLFYPTLTKLVGEDAIAEGVDRVLTDAKVTLAQTDFSQLALKSKLESLVFVSDQDSIAPAVVVKGINKPNFDIVNIKDRPHMSWVAFSEEQEKYLLPFLRK
ncbi:carboxylesterase [Paraferrimonas sp. SM1919]|uniref:alpha/beta hydrolase n=1 Tax=Paraferrimonas sp. SM1919 TaxID=2662263 RepID=UPI0013D78BF2|nr:alpha/beta hydrolase [Paraferrimonas sp. SM1919]